MDEDVKKFGKALVDSGGFLGLLASVLTIFAFLYVDEPARVIGSSLKFLVVVAGLIGLWVTFRRLTIDEEASKIKIWSVLTNIPTIACLAVVMFLVDPYQVASTNSREVIRPLPQAAPFTVQGVVLDRDNNAPVKAAQVILNGDTITTDYLGQFRYTYPDRPRGLQVIRISKEGFVPRVTRESFRQSSKNFKLKRI